MALVAEALLDANPLDQPRLTDEYRANLQVSMPGQMGQLVNLVMTLKQFQRFQPLLQYLTPSQRIQIFSTISVTQFTSCPSCARAWMSTSASTISVPSRCPWCL